MKGKRRLLQRPRAVSVHRLVAGLYGSATSVFPKLILALPALTISLACGTRTGSRPAE